MIDNLMNAAVKDQNIMNMFTVGSHHRKISVIFLTLPGPRGGQIVPPPRAPVSNHQKPPRPGRVNTGGVVAYGV